jgi:sugar phosphate isomerase/epimerase
MNITIPRDFSQDHRWLSINTATVRKQHGVDWPLLDIIDACAQREIRAISPWRDQVASAGLSTVARRLREHNIGLSGYCRGGMFTYPQQDRVAQQAAHDDNLRALDEACELQAACLVLVVGGLPGALSGKAHTKDIAAARSQVVEGIGKLLEAACERKMPLAIEPLHPMYAADRACINTMEQALDLCDRLDPVASGALGVAVDVYHVWWDPKLETQIQRAGEKRLLAFHVCDWLIPTSHMLEDRGMMGDGVIDIPKIRGWVEHAGFQGFSEVEIFSRDHWWKEAGAHTLDVCIQRHRSVV